MANIKSAKKRIKVAAKKTLRNKIFFPGISFANFRLLFYTFDTHIMMWVSKDMLRPIMRLCNILFVCGSKTGREFYDKTEMQFLRRRAGNERLGYV